MNALNHLLMEPSALYTRLMPYLIFFMWWIHLGYLGMVLGSSLFSVYYRKKNDRNKNADLSTAFADLTSDNLSIWFIMGLLPPISLAFLYKLLLYNTPIAIHLYFLRLLPINIIAFALLFLYRRLGHPGLGAAGVLGLSLYAFLLLDIQGILIFPEKWFFLTAPVPYPLYDITPLWFFLEFLLMSLALTGATILLLYFKWPETRLEESSPYYKTLKYYGYILILAGTFPLPNVIFLYLLNLPGYAISVRIFGVTALAIIVICVILYLALVAIADKKQRAPRFPGVLFVFTVLLLGLILGNARLAESNAGTESQLALEADAQKKRAALTAKREEKYTKNMVADVKLGEQVYNQTCSSCHNFDQKVYGPPYNDVLSKYVNKEEALTRFIRNPVKVNPQYPAMPNPGISLLQAKSVAKFLLNKFQAEGKK